MNITVLSIIIIYAMITLYFFFKFFRNNFSLGETIESIKKDLAKVFPCCINKKNIEEKSLKKKQMN